jgi:four helix bundle protein
MAIQSYRDLRVWHVGMDLVESIYRISTGFPNREVYGLTSQMRRAAVSIPSNIAEGHTKRSTKDDVRHVLIAQGSLAELQTQIEIACHLLYVSRDVVAPVVDQSVQLAMQLHALRNALRTQ